MITRRSLSLLVASALWADEQQEIVDWLGRFAGYLTQEDAEDFLRAVDKKLRVQLETNIRAIVRNYETASSVAMLSVEGEGSRRQVELDWFLELRPRTSENTQAKRRERVKLVLEKAKKGWTVLDLTPRSLFNP